MKFYDREKELEKLETIRKQSLVSAKMTVVTGRRRIGKTALLLEATKGQPTLYFFIARKSEILLCQDFVAEIKQKLDYPIFGEITSFTSVFQLIMDISKKRSFNLIIDEFQEFYHINVSVYSDMQHYIDMISLNEIDKNALIAEIKRNPANISMETLINKAKILIENGGPLVGYQLEYKGLSMKDM
jgi:AAA+ ATPase superfamily predicted ATPase